jgi:hypothetical protein
MQTVSFFDELERVESLTASPGSTTQPSSSVPAQRQRKRSKSSSSSDMVLGARDKQDASDLETMVREESKRRMQIVFERMDAWVDSVIMSSERGQVRKRVLGWGKGFPFRCARFSKVELNAKLVEIWEEEKAVFDGNVHSFSKWMRKAGKRSFPHCGPAFPDSVFPMETLLIHLTRHIEPEPLGVEAEFDEADRRRAMGEPVDLASALV